MTPNFKYALPMILLANFAIAAEPTKESQEAKNANDPTKVITKAGISYSDTYDFDDDNWSFSGSIALDAARKINARINSDASEWRIGGSWLFPLGIVNFNFGKNEYSNGANQTNYSVGTFVPLSTFGFEPAGIQIFPTAGYTYNDGESPGCTEEDGKCNEADFTGMPSAENGFTMIQSSGSSGYLGFFALKPFTDEWSIMGFGVGSYGSENDDGENYKGYFTGIGTSYLLHKTHSFNIMTFMMDNNAYLDDPDKRIILSYTYQFN